MQTYLHSSGIRSLRMKGHVPARCHAARRTTRATCRAGSIARALPGYSPGARVKTLRQVFTVVLILVALQMLAKGLELSL